MNNLNIENRSQIERVIAGAIKSTIDTYGPIDRKRVGSASKRVYGQLKGAAKTERPTEPLTVLKHEGGYRGSNPGVYLHFRGVALYWRSEGRDWVERPEIILPDSTLENITRTKEGKEVIKSFITGEHHE